MTYIVLKAPLNSNQPSTSHLAAPGAKSAVSDCTLYHQWYWWWAV